MGGTLGWHWHAWRSFGADEWTVEVLLDGYRVPFHHLPPLSLVSSCSGTSRGSLQDAPEGSSGACGLIRFYSLLFLVEKVRGGGVIDLSALSDFFTLTKFKMETVVSVLGSIRRGNGCSRWTSRLILPDSCPSGILAAS